MPQSGTVIVERFLDELVHPLDRIVSAKGPHALKGKLTGVAMSAADDEELFSTRATWDLP
jgi:hypothetical protein